MSGKVIELTDSTFDSAVSAGVSLVDFWAPWCPPCRTQGPIVENLAADFDGKAMIAKVNVDEEGQSAVKFGVSSIPTIVLFKNGKEVKRFVGLQEKGVLAGAVNGLL